MNDLIEDAQNVKPAALVFIDMRPISTMRLHFAKMMEFLEEKFHVQGGYHVACAPYKYSLDLLADHLPSVIKPFHAEFGQRPEKMQATGHNVDYASVPSNREGDISYNRHMDQVIYKNRFAASLDLFDTVMVNENIQHVHFIVHSNFYQHLIDKVSKEVDTTIYSTDISLRPHAKNVFSWDLFKEKCTFPAKSHNHSYDGSQYTQVEGQRRNDYSGRR